MQIGGPTGAFIIIIYGIIENFGLEGLAVATFMAGWILVLMGLFHLDSHKIHPLSHCRRAYIRNCL